MLALVMRSTPAGKEGMLTTAGAKTIAELVVEVAKRHDNPVSDIHTQPRGPGRNPGASLHTRKRLYPPISSSISS